MKKTFILMTLPFVLAACGGAPQSVAAPEISDYKALELTTKSNADRVLKLEKELDTAKSDIESLRIQNRQLADSYDGMVELFKEHRGLTMMLIQKMDKVMPAETTEKK